MTATDAEMTEKCKDCQIDYPSDLVNLMFSAGEGYVSVCGICALERTNQVHGTKRKSFSGEMAEDVRQRALSFRKKHHLVPR